MISRGSGAARRALSIICLVALGGSAVAQSPTDELVHADAGTPEADAGTSDAGPAEVKLVPTESVPPAPPSNATRLAANEEEDCGAGLYLEPGVVGFVGGGAQLDYGISFRLAGGLLLRICDADRMKATHVRVGGSYYLASQQGHLFEADDPHGAGAELEVDRSITRPFRLGGRLGFEYGRSPLFEGGARVHVGDLAYLGLEGCWAPSRSRAPKSPAQACAMLGVGVEGKIGLSAGYWILGIALGLGLVAFASGAGSS